jgi:hypothetical protein
MAIYEVLVRRVSILRILFGMKIIKASKNLRTAQYVMAGVFSVLVVALAVVSATAEKMSPAPTEPGLYVNEKFGFQFTFPTSMNKQGKLTSYDMLFHIKHPNKTLYLKVRKNAIPADQPLDAQAGKIWIKRIMNSFGMIHPEVLSSEIIATPNGTGALCATIKFETRTGSLVGIYTFFNRKGKRFFLAGYNDGGVKPLEQIMKSLTFK